MQRMPQIFLLMMLFLTPLQAGALETGGELNFLFSSVLQDDGSIESQVAESLDLELFLPEIGDNEIRYAFKLTKPLQEMLAGEESTYFAKKLYLKHRFEHFQLTVGRQPVSWSFGSLLNPVDYTLGAVALDEESSSKYTDAVEAYIPLNWNSSLSMVTSFPEGFTTDSEKMKWGVRSRVGLKGYDLTLNYVREADSLEQASGSQIFPIASLIPNQRLGLSAKGDIGDFGVYGSFGHYFGQGAESSNSYLVGADYSRMINYTTKINMQLEYLGIAHGNGMLDFLTGSVSYPIDDFSSLSLASVVHLDDGSMVLIPSYKSTLPANIDLTVSGSLFLGERNGLFAPGNLMPRATGSIGLSYPF